MTTASTSLNYPLRTNNVFLSAIPQPRRVRMIDEIPSRVVVEWGVKLYTLMQLAWNYIDTIIDLCIQMRITATKPLVRTIRQLRREYDQFRARSIDEEFERKESANAEKFEEQFCTDFDRLFNGLELEIRSLDLKQDYQTLVIAVQQALTIMDAVKLYARWCDQRINEYGVWVSDCCMLQAEFLKLYPLIPQFAGDCYQTNLASRQTTAGILLNRIIQIKINFKDV